MPGIDPRRVARISAVLLIAALFIACAPGASPDPSPSATATQIAASTPPAATPSQTAGPTTRPTRTPAPPSSAPPPTEIPNAAPAELRGVWRTQIGNELISLTLRAGSYQINRAGHVGGGKIAVTDDVIEFFAGDLCQGVGRYVWAISGDALTLEPVVPDECGGRAASLVDVTYTLFQKLE